MPAMDLLPNYSIRRMESNFMKIPMQFHQIFDTAHFLEHSIHFPHEYAKADQHHVISTGTICRAQVLFKSISRITVM